MLSSPTRVELPTGAVLAVRQSLSGDGRPILLVHGLASSSALWNGVARRLGEAGHPVVSVDLRGHGLAGPAAPGFGTVQAAADLSALVAVLGWTGERQALVAGQSWGGNVALTLAARHGGVAGLGLVDGGWIHLRERFPTADAAWELLAPPHLDGLTVTQLRQRLRARVQGWSETAEEDVLTCFEQLPDGRVRARLDRATHRDIVTSLWEQDPGELYALVGVPALLMPAGANVAAAEAAAARMPRAQVRPYPGADHDLHLQHPDAVAADLHALALGEVTV